MNNGKTTSNYAKKRKHLAGWLRCPLFTHRNGKKIAKKRKAEVTETI